MRQCKAKQRKYWKASDFPGGGIESTVVEMLSQLMQQTNKILHRYQVSFSTTEPGKEHLVLDVNGPGAFVSVHSRDDGGIRLVLDGTEYTAKLTGNYTYAICTPLAILTGTTGDYFNYTGPIEFKNNMQIYITPVAVTYPYTVIYGVYE